MKIIRTSPNDGGGMSTTPNHNIPTTRCIIKLYTEKNKYFSVYKYLMSTTLNHNKQTAETFYLIKNIEKYLKILSKYEKIYRKFLKRYKKLKNRIIEKYAYDGIYQFLIKLKLSNKTIDNIYKYVILYYKNSKNYYSSIYGSPPFDSFLKYINKKKINTKLSETLSFFIFSDFFISRGFLTSKIIDKRVKKRKFFSFSPLFRPNAKYDSNFWIEKYNNKSIYSIIENERLKYLKCCRGIASKIINSQLIKTRRFKNLILKYSYICQYEVLKMLNSLLNYIQIQNKNIKQQIIITLNKLERIVSSFIVSKCYNKFKYLVIKLIHLSYEYVKHNIISLLPTGPP